MNLAAVITLTSCNDGQGSTNDPEGSSGGATAVAPSTGDSGEPGRDSDSTTGSADDAFESTGPDPSRSSGETTSSPPVGTPLYEESFDGPDGAPWPDPWFEAGDQVISSELIDGRGRFDGYTTNVARMVLPGFSETDVDIVITVEFDQWTEQGFGLYVRQNGGALLQTDPPGQGYAAYVEGGYMRFLGIWRETNGVEEPLANETVPGGELLPGVAYRLRLQCFTEGSGTRLRTRIWPEGDPEPGTWLVDIVDDTPELQGTAGSFAVDVYNYDQMGSVYVDDLIIEVM